MKLVRSISTILYFTTRIMAWGYLITMLYSVFVLSFKTGFNLENEGKLAVIYYPFTTERFLLCEYNTPGIVEMLLTIGAYGVFFWLLSDVFKAFRQERLFTKLAVTSLSRFYIANLTVPLLGMLLLKIISNEYGSTEYSITGIVLVLHTVLGVFAYFMAAIFKQGVSLQNEQDLYI